MMQGVALKIEEKKQRVPFLVNEFASDFEGFYSSLILLIILLRIENVQKCLMLHKKVCYYGACWLQANQQQARHDAKWHLFSHLAPC